MEKSLFEQMGGRYEMQGDYLIPCLTLPPEEEQSIGIYGQRHLRYIRRYNRLLYTNLLTTCKLNSYLADIDEQAKDMFFRLVKEYADKHGVTEQLKAHEPLEWAQRMNNIRNAVEEVINTELIYA